MTVRIRRFALTALSVVATAIATAPAGAQQAAQAPTAGAAAQDRAAAAGPTVDRAAVGARSHAQRPGTLDDAEAAMQQRLGLGQARALMIVGFAAVIVGLVVGGDPGTLIAIGGAVVGLYGLYHYLK